MPQASSNNTSNSSSGNNTPNSSSGNSTPYSPASTPQSVTFIISPPTSPYPTPATPWSPYGQNPFYDKWKDRWELVPETDERLTGWMRTRPGEREIGKDVVEEQDG
ncbi:hypothetical protein KCU81_g7717, partial [Aureobasidium melanogenum]|uniref:Uncharacterized protein n=1 Tax=Aureobasidium melanogenum (strain CBS 110374) TaxID=1043003 RepID=A0A074VYC7_AURM1